LKVLILGCGYTGTRLVRWLLAQHVPVQVTTRTGIPPQGLPIPCWAFDSTSVTTLPDLALADVTHILHSIPPDVDGQDPVVQHLLPRLSQLSLQWFGYLSTTGVYGDTQGAWVDETAPLHAQNQRSQHRVAAETAFLQSSLPTHIFRLPGIYGPGRSIFERLRDGKAQRIDRPGHVFSRVHVDDIVNALWCSIQQPTPQQVYNVCDDEPTEPSKLITEACSLLGVEPPPLIPFNAANLGPMAASFWTECRRVSNQKLKQTLAVQLRYPTYREGLKTIFAENFF
jgi:nucleoside-diphosphate-sugar epimerase